MTDKDTMDTETKLCREFKEVSSDKGVILDQGDKHPLFIVGEFYNISDKRELGNSFFEIDTGCDRTLLSYEVCKKLKLEVEKFRIGRTVKGVSGNNIRCEDFCVFKFKMSGKETKDATLTILAYVYDLGDIPCLLGNDVLSALKAVINYNTNTLSFCGKTFDLLSEKSHCKNICEN